MKNYVLHLRPKTFLPSFVFVLTGYSLNPLKTSWQNICAELLALFLIYSVLLFGGTCAINSHFDQDQGPLNFLEAPPDKPKYLLQFGVFLMLLGCLLAGLYGTWPLLMSICSLFLSLAYSARIPGIRWRGKEIGGVDVLLDALGCGLIGVILGVSIGGAIPTTRDLWIAAAFTLTVAGSYPATQIFQLKATDTYAKARNFSSLLGAGKALLVGMVFLAVGYLLILGTIWRSDPTTWQWLFYGLFTALFASGLLRMYRWSKAPFIDSNVKFKAVIYTFLGARLFWIAAEWVQ